MLYVNAILSFELQSTTKMILDPSLMHALQWVLQDGGVTFLWQYNDNFTVCGPFVSLECHGFLLTVVAINFVRNCACPLQSSN